MPLTTLKTFLAQQKPFDILSGPDLDSLIQKSIQKQYPKGHSLYNEGDFADRAWVLLEGRLQILKQSPSGKPHAIESIHPGEIFGTLCRMGNTGRAYPCTAVAATPCKTMEIPDSVFQALYKRIPALMTGLCMLCSERLNALQDSTCGAQEPADHRIAGVLLKLQKSDGAVLSFTRREIAELANTTIETTIRTLSSFTKKGWVRSTRGKIELLSTPPLESLLRREN